MFVQDAATLRFTVEKLVGQVDLLSQNELKMIDRFDLNIDFLFFV